MTPGTVQGRVAQARPVVDRLLAHSRPYDPDVKEVSGGGDTLFWKDEFTIDGGGPQVLDLTWRPILNSEHVYWHPNTEDGLYLSGAEWSRLKKRITLADVESLFRGSDKVVVEYAYTLREQEPEPEAPYEWEIVLGPHTDFADPGLGSGGSHLVGSEPVWKDDDSGTYLELVGNYNGVGEPQFVSVSTTAIIAPTYAIQIDPARVEFLVRMQISTPDPGYGLPYPRLQIGAPDGGLSKTLYTPTPATPTWVEVKLEGSAASILQGPAAFSLGVHAPFFAAGTTPLAHLRIRIHEVRLVAREVGNG
jgi:hypothetical protein